jgi:hypothetical protein
MDAPAALLNIKKAMKLAPELDQQMVNDGLAAEAEGNYEQAIEHYFDSLIFNK